MRAPNRPGREQAQEQEQGITKGDGGRREMERLIHKSADLAECLWLAERIRGRWGVEGAKPRAKVELAFDAAEDLAQAHRILPVKAGHWNEVGRRNRRDSTETCIEAAEMTPLFLAMIRHDWDGHYEIQAEEATCGWFSHRLPGEIRKCSFHLKGPLAQRRDFARLIMEELIALPAESVAETLKQVRDGMTWIDLPTEPKGRMECGPNSLSFHFTLESKLYRRRMAAMGEALEALTRPTKFLAGVKSSLEGLAGLAAFDCSQCQFALRGSGKDLMPLTPGELAGIVESNAELFRRLLSCQIIWAGFRWGDGAGHGSNSLVALKVGEEASLSAWSEAKQARVDLDLMVSDLKKRAKKGGARVDS